MNSDSASVDDGRVREVGRAEGSHKGRERSYGPREALGAAGSRKGPGKNNATGEK